MTPTDKEQQMRAAFESHWRSLGWSEGRLARWGEDDESLPPVARGAYMIASIQHMWQSWCAGAKQGTPTPAGEPVAWRVRRLDSPDYWIVFLHYPVDAMMDPEREVQSLYTAPPVREPLSDEQIGALSCRDGLTNVEVPVIAWLVREVEHMHGITKGEPT